MRNTALWWLHSVICTSFVRHFLLFLHRCIRYTKGCRARLFLSQRWTRVVCDDRAVADIHNHDADQPECDRRYAMWKLRLSAKQSSGESTSSVVASVLQGVQDSSMGSFQKLRSLKRLVQRIRDAGIETNHLKVKSKDDLPELYRVFKTKDGEDIVKWDSLTDKNLQRLQDFDHWFCDGTFKCQPLFFEQMFVISAVRGEGPSTNCHPLVFCLTSNRTTDTYSHLLEKLKQLKPGLAPLSVMTDFEKAELL